VAVEELHAALCAQLGQLLGEGTGVAAFIGGVKVPPKIWSL
jgi:hypothetical protein